VNDIAKATQRLLRIRAGETAYAVYGVRGLEAAFFHRERDERTLARAWMDRERVTRKHGGNHYVVSNGVHPLPVVAPSAVVAAERYAEACDTLFGHDPAEQTVTVKAESESVCVVTWRGEFWEARLHGEQPREGGAS
jgi:hypothetical protein